jgi:hypothetical protein
MSKNIPELCPSLSALPARDKLQCKMAARTLQVGASGRFASASGWLAAIGAADGATSHGTGGAMSSADFDEVMAQSRAALDQIAKGSPDGYKALYSVGEDITLGNPFGGFGRGTAAVYEQIERAASHYRDGEATSFETVSHFVGADVATRWRSSASKRRSVASARRATSLYE